MPVSEAIEALSNLISLARPHFSDNVQMLALKQAETVLAALREREKAGVAALARLRELLGKATPGPWELQDGCSWRRIGTRDGDGTVLCPTNSSHDRHPDLTCGRGEDLYANLRLIVEAVNFLREHIDSLSSYRSGRRYLPPSDGAGG